MPFAVAQAREGEFAAPDPGAWDAPPTSFFGAVQAGWDDARRTRNVGVRRNRLQDELFARHAAIARATGQDLPRSYLMSAAEDPRAIGEDDYEAKVEALRREKPQAMAGIETRAQLLARIDRELRGVRTASDRAGRDHPFGTFFGEAAGALSDPLNLIALPFGAEALGARTLAGRILAEGLVNAGVEASQAPMRAADAKVAGPQYGLADAGFDIAAAFAGGAAFRGLIHEPAGWALRRLAGEAADPAMRRAGEVLDRAALDDAAIGPVDGLTHEESLDALVKARPRPEPEPAQELGDLFGEAAALPPAAAPPGITGRAEYYGRAIEAGTFEPDELATDAARFQYKEGADAEGVTARLRGIEVWDPTSSGKVIVFEDRDGRRFIADGHQRRALALRMKEKGWDARLDGYLFREADGWSARQVRTIAALKNIREGSGTILDAAKVFRDAPEAMTDRSLPVTGDFITQARNLARLSPEAFGAVVNKVIPERYGAEIGAMAATRADLHPALVKLMAKAKPANIEEARALVSEALLDDWVKTEGEQADFFGDLPPESTTIARAKVKAAVVNALKKDARIYGQLVKHADAIEAGGNVLLRDANEAAATINRTALEVVSRLSLRAGDVGEAMAAAAREVMAGKRAADAAKGLVQMLRRRLADGAELEGVRAQILDPDPPAAAATAHLEHVDDPKFWEAQARPAPEDEAIEAAPPTRIVGHISPHRFEEFSTDHLRTGEGAMSFGAGLYFAENPDVLAHYQAQFRERLANRQGPLGMAAALMESGLSKAEAIAELQERLDTLKRTAPEHRAETPEAFAAKVEQAIRHIENDDHLPVEYQAELPDTDTYLLWDRPLAEQPAVVRSAFDKLLGGADADQTGEALYKALVKKLRSDVKASQALRAEGVTGTKYLDAGARAGGDGGFNFVVFDAKDIKLEAINGRPVDPADQAAAREAAGLPPEPAAAAEPGPPPGLFDDLAELGGAERAHQRLTACAPAKVETTE